MRVVTRPRVIYDSDHVWKQCLQKRRNSLKDPGWDFYSHQFRLLRKHFIVLISWKCDVLEMKMCVLIQWQKSRGSFLCWIQHFLYSEGLQAVERHVPVLNGDKCLLEAEHSSFNTPWVVFALGKWNIKFLSLSHSIDPPTGFPGYLRRSAVL